MSFSQNLVLWLHVAFVAFTIGPVTVAVMSTPRYIRQRDTRILRYLNRITFVFGLSTLGVLVAGAALASMRSVASKPWVIVAETLYLVALLLLALITRDQRKALKALEDAADLPAPAGTELAEVDPALAQDDVTGSQAGPNGGSGSPAAATAPATAVHLASVERGRVAMMGGLVALIWLVILVLMVWH
jgi:cytochrome bd-type quinol oxidase subunit 1